MSRVQSVNTLALAHPCLLAGPKGVGLFYCPAEPAAAVALEKARERSIAVEASAEAALDRAVVLTQGRPPKGRRGFRMPWRF